MMTGGQALVKSLYREGVRVIFGLQLDRVVLLRKSVQENSVKFSAGFQRGFAERFHNQGINRKIDDQQDFVARFYSQAGVLF